MKPACLLYQLYSQRHLPDGSYVTVNGPFDTYGVVQESKRQPDGTWLNLIRGCERCGTDKPVYQF